MYRSIELRKACCHIRKIEPLARAFLAQASRHLGMPATLSPAAIAALRAYRWPGNIRELRHVIERAVLLAGNAPITPEHLAVHRTPSDDRARDDEPERDDDKGDDKGEDELRRIVEVLAACGGNQSRAAKQLGMSRGALIRRLERYDITRPRKPD